MYFSVVFYSQTLVSFLPRQFISHLFCKISNDPLTSDSDFQELRKEDKEDEVKMKKNQ